MLIFGIDTCCMAATAAIISDDRLIAQTVINHKKTHSQKMMPQIEEMFALAEVDISEIDCFAAAAGPGSFTGVRIGVATAKAFAQAANKSCAAVSTLHALANNVSLFDGLICPMLDARRNQVYSAFFHGADFSVAGYFPRRLCEDRAVALSALLEELMEMDEPVLFLGDGTLVFREEITKALGERAQFAPRMQNLNLAASVAELGAADYLAGNTVTYQELTPEYIRLSQAERERKEREAEK